MEGDRIDEKIGEVVGRAGWRGTEGFRYLETSARLMVSCFFFFFYPPHCLTCHPL